MLLSLTRVPLKVEIAAVGNDERILILPGSDGGGLVDWIPKHDRTFGTCFSMEFFRTTRNASLVNIHVLDVTVKAKMNIYLYLHHPGQFVDPDSKTKVIRLIRLL